LISIHIRIPRVIYVNSFLEHTNKPEFRLINKKKLPREKRSIYLYEVSLNEDEYHEKYKDFDYFLTNPNIEGVYEMNLHLEFKLITNVGNIA